jgi:hypothetical protein
MKDLLRDRYLHVVVFGTKPIGMTTKEWVVLDKNTRNLLRLCLAHLVLLNIFEKKLSQLSTRG